MWSVFANQRGSVLLFTTVMLVFIFVIVGFAVDIAWVVTVKGELQRSLDAAALAGAGNLGFDETAFPAARNAAQAFAGLNAFRSWTDGSVGLALNGGNDPGGDIVLGIWEDQAFTASDDGTRVNAVRCRFTTAVPTTFLGLLGLTSIPVAAFSTAVVNPPLTPPTSTCVFPIGLTQCPFQDAGAFNTQGCAAPVTFISSSGSTPGGTSGTNTAAWVNLTGTGTPSAPETRNAILQAAAGLGCEAPASGTDIGTNNGMQQSVFDVLEAVFIEKFNTSETITMTNTRTGASYSGRGWQVFVPIIETACPPQAISGTHRIVGWTQMVITQVVNRGLCSVENANDANSWSVCPQPMNPQGPEQRDPNLRAVFGVYSCEFFEAPPNPNPAPIAALATRLRLVQ